MTRSAGPTAMAQEDDCENACFAMQSADPRARRQRAVASVAWELLDWCFSSAKLGVCMGMVQLSEGEAEGGSPFRNDLSHVQTGRMAEHAKRERESERVRRGMRGKVRRARGEGRGGGTQGRGSAAGPAPAIDGGTASCGIALVRGAPDRACSSR